MGIFEEIFAPSSRFRDEERERNEWLRDDEGDGDPHKGPIDLESGIVRIAARPPVDGGAVDKPAQ